MNSGRQKSVFRDLCSLPYKSNYQRYKLYSNCKDDLGLIQRFGLIKRLPIHNGCVNTISWNESGEYILSGSDDQRLIITHGHNYKVLKDYHTRHSANIFSAKFLPETCDHKIVSCSGDGLLLYTDINEPEEQSDGQFNCHYGTTYEVVTVPHDPFSFLSCGEDGTVRWFDLRLKSKCSKPRCRDDVIITTNRAVTALALNPHEPHLAIACSDSSVQIFDRRFLSAHIGDSCQSQPFCTFTAPDLDDRPYRITSLNYSEDGQDVLVSYSSEHLYLFGIKKQEAASLKKQYSKSGFHRDKVKGASRDSRSLPIRRLRLRGDWSDTGPDARPESDASIVNIGQARPHLHSTLMQRMTDVLSRMLNDPLTRAALSAGGEDSLDDEIEQPAAAVEQASDVQQPSSSEEAMTVDSGARDESAGGDVSENSATISADSDDTEMADMSDNSALNQSSQSDALREQQEATTASSTVESGGPAPAIQHKSAIATHLRNHLNTLRNLRHGFIEQHGLEPSVSLKYSEESTSTSTISLKIGNEVRSADTSDNMRCVGETPSGPSTSSARGHDNASTAASEDMSDVDVDYDSDDDEPAFSAPSRSSHMKARYVGHRNARTMIKEATFWGNDHVMSGSDCGHIFIWNRHTTSLEMLLQADQHVVNCLQPHPTLPILASSGIDHDVKLWMPNQESSSFDAEWAENLVKRNAVMLEETRDTITVPAAFMIRMLACLNQIRRGNRRRSRTVPQNQEEAQ